MTLAEITSARSLIEGLVDDYDGWLVLSLYEESIDPRVDRPQELLEAATGPVVIPRGPDQAPAEAPAGLAAPSLTCRGAPAPRTHQESREW